jgi:hypothetical protein
MPETPQEFAQAVTAALWGVSDITNAQLTAQRAVEAIPDGWAKVTGEWVQLEPVTVTHWRVVRNANGGISYSASSRDDRPGLRAETVARQWAKDHPHDYHLEVWEQTWASSPSVWRQVEPATGDPS